MSKLDETDLMPYQTEGVARILAQNRLYLGDDPGLGKTAQVICAAKQLPQSILDRGILLIVPASLRMNWHHEWEMWGGPKCELYIMSYQEAAKDAQGLPPKKGQSRVGVLERQWGLVAFDEAHALKNTKSQRSKVLVRAVYKEEDEATGRDYWVRTEGVRADKIVFMSGTPILNQPSDIFNLLRHLDPNTWSSKTQFEQRYCDGHVDKFGRWDVSGISNEDELRRKLKPLLLRRRKKDVLTQLPAKRRQVIEIEIGKRDQASVNRMMYEMMGQGCSGMLTDSDEDLKWTVKAIEGDVEGKLFDHVARVRMETGVAKIKPFTDALIEQHSLGVLPKKLVVFAHHRKVIEEVTDALNKKGIKSSAYYGGMNDTAKHEVVRSFQDGDLQVFVGSIMAAGVGLTLTAADTCMILEPSYVPAENTQAEDRLHRIGATKPVLIQYIAAANTLDARVLSLVVDKMEMISKVLH